jgi:hypothetical protein
MNATSIAHITARDAGEAAPALARLPKLPRCIRLAAQNAFPTWSRHQ